NTQRTTLHDLIKQYRSGETAAVNNMNGSPAPVSGDGGAGLVRFVAESTEGSRNTRLFWAACRAAEGGHLDALADQLTSVAVSTGLDAREVQRTLQSAAREAGESPRSSEPQAGDFHDLFDRTSRNPDAFDSEVPSRRARITWASQIEPEPVVWAWRDGEHGRIPAGSLSVAAGREGTGKSSF